MELDELKKSWNALDEHLKDKELISSTEISRIIKRTGKKIDAIALLNIKIILLSIPIVGILLMERFMSHMFSTAYLIILIALIPALCWDVFTAYYLKRTKIDEMPLIEVIKRINRYQCWLIRERLISIFFILGIAIFSFINWRIWEYGLFAILLFGVLWLGSLPLILWVYQHKFMTKIQSIKRNLNEIKEIKD